MSWVLDNMLFLVALLDMQTASPMPGSFNSCLGSRLTTELMPHAERVPFKGHTFAQSAHAPNGHAERVPSKGYSSAQSVHAPCAHAKCVPLKGCILPSHLMPLVPMQGEHSRGPQAQPQKPLSPAPSPDLPSERPVPRATAAKPDRRCCPP